MDEDHLRYLLDLRGMVEAIEGPDRVTQVAGFLCYVRLANGLTLDEFRAAYLRCLKESKRQEDEAGPALN